MRDTVNPRRIAAYTAMYWHCVYVKFQAKLMSGQSDIMIYNGHVSRSRNVWGVISAKIDELSLCGKICIM